MKIMVGCGAFLGFRSIEEHVQLQVGDFSFGTYCPDHEFGGLDYVKIDVLRGSKGGKKLSVHSVYYKDTKNMMRIPILTCDTICLYPGLTLDSCLGGSLKRLLSRAVGGQIRLYCYPIKGTDDIDPTRPLGRAKITSLHKQSAMKLGLDMTFFSGGHAWRKLFCTILANDPNISLAEGMKASRHSSVSNHLGYTTADNGTEANRWKSFLGGSSKVHIKCGPVKKDLDKKPPAIEEVMLESLDDMKDECESHEMDLSFDPSVFDKDLREIIENDDIFELQEDKKVTPLVVPTISHGSAQLNRSPQFNSTYNPATPPVTLTSRHAHGSSPVARGSKQIVHNPYVSRKVSPVAEKEKADKEKAMKMEIDRKTIQIQTLERRIRDFNLREEEMTHHHRHMADETMKNFEEDCKSRIRDVEKMAGLRETRYRNHIRRLSINLEDYRVRLADMEQIYDFDQRANSHPSRNH